MKLSRIILTTITVITSVSLSPRVSAQTNGVSAEVLKSAPASTNSLSAAELEAKFKTMMDNSTLTGRWCTVKDGKMSPDKEDKYTIVGVEKIGGENWVVRAHIQYGERDFVAPIPVKIKWAGDTAVLGVDKLPVPGGGVYTARVLFYDNTYSGTWTGGAYGGLLHGTITHTNN